MHSQKKPIIILLFTLTYFSCSGEPTAAPIEYNTLGTMNITDKIVLSSSEFINADSVKENIYIVNFGKTDTFIEGKTLDVSVSYTTPTSCDKEVFIFNNITSQWDQLGFQPSAGVCFDAISRQRHLLSTINFFTENFIDSKGKVLIKYSRPNYGIGGKIFEVSSDYFESSAPISKFGNFSSKIDFVDDSFWIFTDRDNLFHNKFMDGREKFSIRSQSEQVSAFSVDEQTIWYIEPEGIVFGIDNIAGGVKCLFETTILNPTGLTTDGNELWISFNSSSKSKLHSYDLSRSCENSVGVLLKNIEFSDTYVLGLDWNGSNLLVLDNKLNVVDNEGLLIRAYTLEVFGAHQVVWDGEAAMLFHHGPFSGGSNESIITRFLLK